MKLLVFTILVPLAAGLLIGWRGGRDGPQSPGEFARSCGFALAWGTAVVFLWQALWLFSASGAGLARIATDAGYWTVISALIWAPALVIAYVIRARRRLAE